MRVGFFVTKILLLLIAMFIGGSCLQYVIDFWGTKLAGHEGLVPLLPCVVVSLFTADLPIPLAIITWLYASFS